MSDKSTTGLLHVLPKGATGLTLTPYRSVVIHMEKNKCEKLGFFSSLELSFRQNRLHMET